MHLKAVVLNGIYACGVVMVMWTRVAGEDVGYGLAHVGRQSQEVPLRVLDSQRGLRRLVGEAGACAGVAVGVGDIGLDVEDGGAVDEVVAGDNEDWALLDAEKTDGGEADGVGTEGAAGGKDPYPAVAAEARGPYRKVRGGR